MKICSNMKFYCAICNAHYFSTKSTSYGLPLIPDELISYRKSNNHFALKCSQECKKDEK